MEFYALSIDEGQRKKFAYGVLVDDYPNEEVICTHCGREWDKDLLIHDDIALEIVLSNNYYSDFLGVIYHVLISDKVYNLLKNEKVTGFHLKDVVIKSVLDLSSEKLKELSKRGYIVKKFSHEKPLYYRLLVDGNAQAHKNSEVILTEFCEICGFELYTTIGKSYIDPFHPIYIDMQTWNGDDLFLVKELGSRIFCTEKFKNIYNNNNLSGLIFDKVKSI